jgi:sigma-B regulation protein RsbU (phosphoserine phosphatase)
MEHQESKKLPLGVLYGLLGLLFVWAVLYIVPMSRDVTSILFRSTTTVGTPFIAAWPDGELQFTSRDLERRSVPPLHRGDRIVSVDGQPFRTNWEIARRVVAAGPTGTLRVVVARRTESGAEEEIASTVALRSVAQGESAFAFRGLAAVVGLLMPWVCFLVGFWVAAVRPRDPLAWLVLFMLLGFQVAAFQQQSFERWSTVLRVPAAIYSALFGGTWPLTFPLFGIHFAGRLDWERRHGWIKWIVLAPVAAFAAGEVVVAIAATLDLRGLVGVMRLMVAVQPFAQLFGMAAVTLFFLSIGWKSGVATQADGRRRLRLLLGGGTVALTPVLCLIVASRFLGRSLESFPVGVLVSCLIFLPVFPLTLAYVILVDRAMDVRVAVRQGLRYAVTRGVIRTIVALFMASVLWNAWNLVNDPTANRPRKLQAIAWSMAVALVVPRFAKRAFDWTDRRFFREAYDVERVLTELSEEVRTIAETGPLLDTVLDRIGTTLHVDRLAVFLHEGNRLLPSRSRGFDPPPTVEFPVTAEAFVRLRESGRPLRVRHDDPESPLRREIISDDVRAGLAEVGAELVLPLNGKSDLLGVITLGPKKSEEPYSISDAKLLGSVASQTGLALENSRLMAEIVTEIAKREWIAREIDIARDVQRRLFPQKLPVIAGVDCAGACRPAQGVGGDYFDFLALSGGRLGVALGDVAGKGIPAALLMASLQASLRGQRLSGPADLAQLMTNLNFLIHEASPENRYATFFYGELDPKTRRLDYVNAGHNAPMILRVGGAIERMRATGPVVGLIEGGRFLQESVSLSPGDVLLVYSDGISEAMNANDEEWGEEHLAAAATAAIPCRAQELIDKLFIAADGFVAGAVQHDDMTVVVVSMNA